MRNDHKRREKQRGYARWLLCNFKVVGNCPNCGEKILYGGGHFVPPSLGEPGFFVCDKGEKNA